jgi:hypothetical protein
MIETNEDCNRFLLENIEGDWIIHIVPIEDGVHPATTRPSIIFIKNIQTKKIYFYAYEHPDSVPDLDPDWVAQHILSQPDKIKWTLDKKSLVQLYRLPNVRDINLCGFLKNNEILELSDFETPAHNLVRKNASGQKNINKAIPLMKHLETFEDMCESLEEMINGFSVDNSFFNINDTMLDTLGEIEENGIFVERELFGKRFSQTPSSGGYVFSQYNIYTSTGRPSNRFGGVNYAALNHTDGSRSCFRSRYGEDGRMVLIDYTAFHPRIICSLIGYPLSTEIDIYEYLAKLYYQKPSVDETDILNAKKLTFRQLYGGVEDQYSHIKYLANLKSYIDEQWEFFQTNGYIITPLFKRKITSYHILDPNPSKLFNYILQAVEGEVAIPTIQSVLKYLRGKRTKAVLYTYDSVLYDFHKGDELSTLNEIRNKMSMNGHFPMKTYIGETYQNLQLLTL